ncbi:MAG TPA: hypothetical protein VLW50_12430 [Streptosporangiaceae bacterium]|nr:hypothetical protein [Streptosporangiaceae bacterium]
MGDSAGGGLAAGVAGG